MSEHYDLSCPKCNCNLEVQGQQLNIILAECHNAACDIVTVQIELKDQVLEFEIPDEAIIAQFTFEKAAKSIPKGV